MAPNAPNPAIAYDPSQPPSSSHNLTWAKAHGYTYSDADGMYRDSEGKLVDTPTRDKTYAPFGRHIQGGDFWSR